MNRKRFAEHFVHGARARVAIDGHAENCVAAVRSNFRGSLVGERREGLFDACNKALHEASRPEMERTAFDRLAR